ncbi:DNA polymerase III subunit delta [Campylobacter peloridis]|uniref:DNA polymerase III subunit delta n=1 Tax=Campylobacter peloridis TaxID=488546 RepID=A0ABX6TTF2_9BACT|nr:DNA polymerase III subunit delta [Campylobacter peloridis]AJC84870.1 DNA polymerase III, delta subunit [Campylobacter peloridis LMG 23910]MBX1886361.1 DNA polymerase III subunit delta [Campylobacter peloridis]MBX2078155.1 DNA polymerase III subunit delta [Campylobacter peloridis]QOQ88905.1 DNA polymerase III subunit delta [Campylobacter peloridis]
MYKNQLQNLLKQNNIPNFFLLYGADNFQIELYAKFIKDKFTFDESLKFYFEEYDFKQAYDYLSSASLFSEKKLLEIKTQKKIPSKELKQLVDLCQNSQDNYFLLEIYDESSKQNEAEKIFSNNFCRFYKVNSAKEGIELLALKAQELNIKITQNALFALFYNFNENLYLAANELNKFSGLNIDEKIIQDYCYSLSTISFESFFDNLMQKKDLRNDLEKILDNYNEIAILNSLYTSFLRLFKISLHVKTHGNLELKEILGYTPPAYVAQNLQKQAFMIKIPQYKNIFLTLAQCEYELKKNSKIEKKEFLISTLLQISSILKS